MEELKLSAIVIGLAGGLALFLYGMEKLTEALKLIAGDRMKNLLARMTSNRFKGVATGATITATIQSSSVTTVLVVGFVSAGLLNDVADLYSLDFDRIVEMEGFGQVSVDNLRNAIEASVKAQVMDAIVAAHGELELPASLIAQEVNAMRQQMFQQFGGAAPQDMDLASILPDEMFADQAERRVKLGLVVAEMISQFELTAEPAKVREAIEDIASTYQDPEEVINWYYSENEQLAGIESRVLEDAVVEKLLSTAAIAEVECSYQDALAKARPATPAE